MFEGAFIVWNQGVWFGIPPQYFFIFNQKISHYEEVQPPIFIILSDSLSNCKSGGNRTNCDGR